MIDRNPDDDIEKTIGGCLLALDTICAGGEKDRLLPLWPRILFLDFAATSQLLPCTLGQQGQWITWGLQAAGKVLGQRGAGKKYGKGLSSPTLPEAAAIATAQIACEKAKESLDRANLAPIPRTQARMGVVYEALLPFCVTAKILEPKNLGTLMSYANERVAEVIRSGWLTRNEIKIRG